MTTLHYQFRGSLSHFYNNNDATLALFLNLITRKNARGRCYPTQEQLASDLGCTTNTIKSATDKLISMKAIRLVPFEERVLDEKELPNRRTVYEITGQIVVGKATIPVFYYGEQEEQKHSELMKVIEEQKAQIKALSVELEALHSSMRSGMDEQGHSSVEFIMKPVEGKVYIRNKENYIRTQDSESTPPAHAVVEPGDQPSFERMLEIAQTVASLALTEKRSAVLSKWLLAGDNREYAPALAGTVRQMNELVKLGLLAKNDAGEYSTTLQSTEPKCELMSLTYGELDLTVNYAGESVEPERKPFWETAAAVIAWNDSGIRNWRLYKLHATEKEWLAFNGKVKALLQRFQPWHDDTPIHPHEFQQFVFEQYEQWIKDKDNFSFTTSDESITKHFPGFRVQWRMKRQAVAELAVAS